MVTNRSAPTAPVVPVLIYDDVGQAIDWLCQAFGFSERLRAERDGVIGHAQLTVGEVRSCSVGRVGHFTLLKGTRSRSRCTSRLLMPINTSRTRSSLVHASFRNRPTCPSASDSIRPRDHAGHWWTFSQHAADVAPEEWGATTGPRSGP